MAGLSIDRNGVLDSGYLVKYSVAPILPPRHRRVSVTHLFRPQNLSIGKLELLPARSFNRAPHEAGGPEPEVNRYGQSDD
jgi:hypothetical protein